ncbi:MAG: aminopeptidase N [Candidatus Dormibacteria bacterium]
MLPDDLLRSEAEARAALLSHLRYRVDLDLGGAVRSPTFTSSVDIEVTAASAAPTFLDLDAARVQEATLNDVPLGDLSLDGNRLQLPALREGRNRIHVVAEMRYSHTGMGLHRVADPADGECYTYTQCEPYEAHRVFACFDQPDLKATFTLSVAAPASWEVVSNARAESRSDRGDGVAVTSFAETARMSTYLVAVVGGPYARVSDSHDGIELNLYCRRSMRRYLEEDEIFEVTKQGLEHFRRRFDMPYPFGDKYDQLFVPEFNAGAMENVACVTFREEMTIYRGPVTATIRSWRAGTILHEMAHMWFGDLVTMRWWDDLWLNESFATYMANDAQATATRFSSAWVDFANGDKTWAAVQDQLPTTHPIVADVPDVSTGRLNFDGISYAKGASVLKQLVAWVGEDAFFEGVREYFRIHQWTNASLRDFLAPLSRASGRDLAAWSGEWLQTAGMNVLRLEVATTADSMIERVTVEQAPATPSFPTLRSHHLRMGLFDLDDGGRLTRIDAVDIDVSGPRTEVEALRGRARPALLLPNDGDLTFAKIRLDAVSRQTVLDHLSDIDDPLARSLIWAAMWDMTRDAELPAHQYLDLVARHAPEETVPTILDDLLGQARSAVELYADPDRRRPLRGRLRETAAALLERSAPGSPLQLTALQSMVSASDRPGDLEVAAGLLEGRGVPQGIDVDQDLRWSIVRRLAAAGVFDEADIAAEGERDRTDLGTRMAAAARAGRPDAAAKATAWAAIVDVATPLAMKRSLISGIQQRDQEDLYAPYLQRWVELVPALWRERGAEEAESLTAGLYPAYRSDEAVLEAADQLLQRGDLHDSARRLVMEARDTTRRLQRAREADRVSGTEALARA